MKKLCDEILRAMREGRDMVLLSVCERRGSAPRGLGAAMLVFRDKTQRGTIGGGAVEFSAAREATALFESGGSRMLSYRLSASEIASAGMICGGSVRVLMQHLTPSEENRRLFERLAEARDAGGQAALLRRIEDGRVSAMGCWDGRTLYGMTAELPKTGLRKAWLSEDGSLLYEPVSLGARAVIFGGGHVSRKLAPLLSFVDFRCVICEDREDFADPAQFPPEACVLLGDFSRIDSFTALTEDDFAVVLTRGHQADYEILSQLLRTGARYIGCIGSRHKIRLTKDRLKAEGFSEEDCARVHTPIGLPIGAETPEEIAVSIAAEMILARAQA